MAVQTVYSVLAAAGSVTALVPAAQITPLVRMQSVAPPAITLQRISMVPTNHLGGSSSLDSNRVQLDVWASSYSSAKAIAVACRAALAAANHQMLLEVDQYDAEVDPELFRITQDWSVWTS